MPGVPQSINLITTSRGPRSELGLTIVGTTVVVAAVGVVVAPAVIVARGVYTIHVHFSPLLLCKLRRVLLTVIVASVATTLATLALVLVLVVRPAVRVVVPAVVVVATAVRIVVAVSAVAAAATGVVVVARVVYVVDRSRQSVPNLLLRTRRVTHSRWSPGSGPGFHPGSGFDLGFGPGFATGPGASAASPRTRCRRPGRLPSRSLRRLPRLWD